MDIKGKRYLNVQNILVVFPSNVGDTVLCFPAIDYVKGVFPQARLCVVAGEKTRELLLRSDFADTVFVYRKDWKWYQKLSFSLSLRGKYQYVIDFKNSALPIFAAPYIRTPFARKPPISDMHKKDYYF